MKILVTGASGNVGRYVVESLLKMNETVIAASTNVEKLKQLYNNPQNLEFVSFDFLESDTYAEALKEVDRIFLMRPPHLGEPNDLYPFIKELTKRKIKLISFLSLMGIEKNPIPPHYKIEKMIEENNLPFCHIRPGFFMQNLSGIHADEIKEKNEIFVPAGNSKTSFIDAKDIGYAIATMLHEPVKYQNTAYTLTGPESITYHEVASILSEVLSRQIIYKKPSILKYRKYYIKDRGLDKKYVNVTVMLYIMTRLGTAKKVTQDFYELTGKNPRTFKQFALENKANWMKE